jgi:serine O-acetyltransferase
VLKVFFTDDLTELRQDWRRRFAKHPGTSLWWRVSYYHGRRQYRTLFYYRLWSSARSRIGRRLCGFLYRRNSSRTGIEFLTPRLGGGVIMPHWGRIILNADSIGQNLYVFHNVTVGNDYRTGKPTIGSNVFIGTGSTVIGRISVGDNVVIAACSLVNHDVPSNSLVAGNPAKVVKTIDRAYIDAMIGY